MRLFIALASMCYFTCLHSEEPSLKQSLNALRQLENCYDAIYPAQERGEHAFVWLSGIPDPFLNAVMHLSCPDVIQKVDELLSMHQKHPLSFWVHPGNQVHGLIEVLQARHFSPIIQCTLMTWPVQEISSTPYDIHLVHGSHMDAFMEITSQAFGMDGVVKEVYAKFINKASIEKYLLYVDRVPIATGILVVHKNTGGIFNIAVLPEYQKRGYGQAIMHFLMHRAHFLGLKQLVLLSSPLAKMLYLRLGFEQVFDIDVYAKD